MRAGWKKDLKKELVNYICEIYKKLFKKNGNMYADLIEKKAE